MDAAAAHGVRIVAAGEPDYPPALAVIDAAPPLLARARRDGGVRPADGGHRGLAQRLRRGAAAWPGGSRSGLGQAGFVVVSGLARGIDAPAHRPRWPTGTVAVLAGGHDRLYPPENARADGAHPGARRGR